jgi:asparagine synthase (glutamine-hydrolysing)
MSGIVGLVTRDASAVDESALSEMLKTLDHRGPDGAWMETIGRVGLGQQRYHTTSEATHDDPPLERDSCLLTADARIDNREELLGRLDIDTQRVVSDADLLLAAYDRWRTACPEHVVGAYAFALWDNKRERLFCARDHVGVKPFYYAASDNTLAFASEVESLLGRTFVTRQLDERAVGDYLMGFCEDTSRTVYSDLHQLPPAHWMVVDTDGIETTRYWSIDDTPELDYDSDEAYVKEFQRRFEAAVKARLRAPEDVAVGTMLSGGLDSLSVACTANRSTEGSLPTFTLSFEDLPPADEREYVDAVHDEGDFEPHFVDGERQTPYEGLDEMLDRIGVPFMANNLYLHWELFRAANDREVGVLLDGIGGDQAVSRGRSRLPELLLRGRPLAYLQEVMAHSRRYDRPIRRILHRDTAVPLAPCPVRRAWRHMFTTADPLRRRSSVVDEEFAARLDLRSRARELEDPPRQTARSEHRRVFPDGLEAHDCEMADAAAAGFGVEPRYPFYDRRLLELCFQVPGHLKFRNGWTRWILRAAMAETLPEAVRNRTTKGNLGASFTRLLRSADVDAIERTCQSDPFPEALDRERALSALEAFAEGKDESMLGDVWRPAVFCRWFQHTNPDE